MTESRIEQLCNEKRMKMTAQGCVIARVLSDPMIILMSKRSIAGL